MTAVNKRFLYIRDSSYLHYTLSVNALPFKTVRIAHGLLFYNERMKRTETRAIKAGNIQIGGQDKVIIQSMTPEERANPDIINGSRRRRIANGSGSNIQDVNRLLKQFEDTRKIMRMENSGKAKRLMRAMNTPGRRPF